MCCNIRHVEGDAISGLEIGMFLVWWHHVYKPVKIIKP
jgi:hypothetical protein